MLLSIRIVCWRTEMPPSLPIGSVQYALCNTIAVQPLRANFTQQNILFVQYDAPVQTVHGSTAHSAQPIKNISKMAPRVKIEWRRHRSAFFLDRESLHEAPSESFSIGISLKVVVAAGFEGAIRNVVL